MKKALSILTFWVICMLIAFTFGITVGKNSQSPAVAWVAEKVQVLFDAATRAEASVPAANFDSSRVTDEGKYFGIDVSTYQGDIDWSMVGSKHPITFVIARASMGDNRHDSRYKANSVGARGRGFVFGSYHYYDPHDDPVLQAENFCRRIDLRPGDLLPVVDIEDQGSLSLDVFQKQVQTCLDEVERRLGMKPIVYTGLSFYEHKLQSVLGKTYPLWIAAYSENRRSEVYLHAQIHQFSESLNIKGIKGPVDGNDIDIEDADQLVVSKSWTRPDT